jgi:hypothetical protein
MHATCLAHLIILYLITLMQGWINGTLKIDTSKQINMKNQRIVHSKLKILSKPSLNIHAFLSCMWTEQMSRLQPNHYRLPISRFLVQHLALACHNHIISQDGVVNSLRLTCCGNILPSHTWSYLMLIPVYFCLLTLCVLRHNLHQFRAVFRNIFGYFRNN